MEIFKSPFFLLGKEINFRRSVTVPIMNTELREIKHETTDEALTKPKEGEPLLCDNENTPENVENRIND